MRIVQLANLVTEQSGGIRTTIDRLGRGYAAAGHERHVVLPAEERGCRRVPGGIAWLLPGIRVPASGGYRVLLARTAVRRLLDRLVPDTVEVSDRWTLTWVARWARARGVRSVALVHEHLGDTLAAWPGLNPVTAQRVAGTADKRLVTAFDAVVCASSHSAAPFDGAARVVPLGVDLATFRPRPVAPPDGVLDLVLVSRLSSEKRPELALAALRHLLDDGVPARLSVIGDGPLRSPLTAQAASLPVRFHGHVAGRAQLAGMVATATVALSTCPTEAFGLAALEALACGTPVVATGGGTGDLLAGADAAAGQLVPPDDPAAMAAAAARLGSTPRAATQRAARAIAGRYPWSRTVAGLLDAHTTGRTDAVVAA